MLQQCGLLRRNRPDLHGGFLQRTLPALQSRLSSRDAVLARLLCATLRRA